MGIQEEAISCIAPGLSAVAWTHQESGESETLAVADMFVMIGAAPNTDRLNSCLMLGIFAVGDIRAGSTKRVASAVEGSAVISDIHHFLEAKRG